MIYLDYSATTPVNDEVLNSFNKVCREYVGNANSIHKLGIESKHLMEASTKQVADLFQVDKEEVIFTSSASEANNMALIGIVEKYPLREKRIITTKLEHSSILETVYYLEKKGYIIDYVNILENGKIDLEDLSRLLKKNPVLVSIGLVNSEIGIIQDIDKIKKLVKENKRTILHVDGTQAVGKIKVSLKDIDLFSCSAHKFFGLKGIGCLIKKKNIDLEPIIHGGKSQTIYRSGTPALPLIVSFSKALRLALENIDKKYNYVKELNSYLREELKKIKGIEINSDENCSAYILNISIKGIKPETMIHALEEYEVYLSTKTACSSDITSSLTLETMNKPKAITTSSLRISLSSLTTKDELIKFIEILKKCYDALNLKKEEY